MRYNVALDAEASKRGSALANRTVYIVYFETNVLYIFDKVQKCGYVFCKNC